MKLGYVKREKGRKRGRGRIGRQKGSRVEGQGYRDEGTVRVLTNKEGTGIGQEFGK